MYRVFQKMTTDVTVLDTSLRDCHIGATLGYQAGRPRYQIELLEPVDQS